MTLLPYLEKHHIDLTGVLRLSDCRVVRPYLIERAGFTETDELYVQLFAIPYLSPAADAPDRNLSAYAVCEDYHAFVRELFDALLPVLHVDFPGHRFAGFADHSPIDEIDAAVAAGLGIRGRHHLLLTERYSSYVFLGEIVTDLPLQPTPSPLPETLRVCHGCGKCMAACPMTSEGGDCRSALTQKKGTLTQAELDMLGRFHSVWGCDVCQEVCPYTAHARARGSIYSPIPFFNQNTLPRLTEQALAAMSDEAFARRAYAWRGRETIGRNLALHKTKGKEN